MKRAIYWAVLALAAAALVGMDAPSWLALGAGLALALLSGQSGPPKRWTAISLQVGVIALGAGMNLEVIWRTGLNGALITATSLSLAVVLGLALGRWLHVPGDTPLLVSVGTAICGGSAIAAVASVIRPNEHEMSVALAVVFVLNAVGLVLFPLLGHAFGLSEPVFGRWAALAIHDTSSVVGAGLAYGKVALAVATTTKLARALWIVPLTISVAIVRQRDDNGSLRDVRWPWFILGFVIVAGLVTWVPSLAVYAPPVVKLGRHALVLALFLIGASLSRDAIAKVGARPLVLGVILWIVIASISLPLAMLVD